MRAILQKRGLRFVFAANVISMLGSGMNSAAVAWTVLQRTHSEMALGTFAVLQTLPAMVMLPFTGVIIDREDRRRLVMWLDAGRALIILVVAVLAYRGRVQVWQLYLMNTLVAAGFWMFWPTITALIQESTDRVGHGAESVKEASRSLERIEGHVKNNTGQLKEQPMIPCMEPWESIWVGGRLYIGMNLMPRLAVYDPATDTLTDLGEPFTKSLSDVRGDAA